MVEYRKQFGLSDAELVSYQSVYRSDLFAGETVPVSGAATGIGRGIAALFARLGANLVICGRNAERLQEAAGFFEGLGADVLAVPMGIRDAGAVTELMATSFAHFGQVDHLINNAGGQFASNALDISPNGWRAVVDTNLNGSWYMMQNIARHWTESGRGGTITSITAITERGVNQMAHTVASRAGVQHLTRALAVEWAPHDIRVNSIAVGIIASSGFNNYAEENLEHFFAVGPMRRPGNVMDIAEACVYLSASSGNFITGQTLTVAGGSDLHGDLWPAGIPEHFK